MPDLEAAVAAADAVADRFLDGKHIPGLVYGIVGDGELLHCRGIGTLRVGEDALPDADSVFRIASMTKSFTAATILALRDEGRLGLDDPIADHVPELADLKGPTRDSPVITVRHLLTMSSGLATDDPWGDRQQGLDLGAFSELLRGGLTFAWPPGVRFEYSNLGYGILGRLITNVAGAEYRDVVKERLLDPLGMAATTYVADGVPPARLARGYIWRDDGYAEEPLDPYGALASMGGIFSSVRDLARWVGFFTDAFPPRDDPEGDWPLSRASRREMQQVHRATPAELELSGLDGDPITLDGGYGFGLGVTDDSRWGRIVAHSGGYPGFGSIMRWQPASGLGVIALANHRYAPTGLLARDVLRALLAAGAAPARTIRPAPPTTAARAEIERLLATWDEAAAERLFAMNVELDEPMERRRREIDRIRGVHGRLEPDPELPDESETPLHLAWWLVGTAGGRVRVEIRLSPEASPRVQTFGLASVPEPVAALTTIADAVVGAVNAPLPVVPSELELAPAVDRAALGRILRIVGAGHAPVSRGPAVAGDGVAKTTWRLRGERGELELAVERDAATGLIHRLELRQRPPTAPAHAD